MVPTSTGRDSTMSSSRASRSVMMCSVTRARNGRRSGGCSGASTTRSTATAPSSMPLLSSVTVTVRLYPASPPLELADAPGAAGASVNDDG